MGSEMCIRDSLGGDLFGTAAGFGVQRAHFHGLGTLAIGALVATRSSAPALAEADDGEEDGKG